MDTAIDNWQTALDWIFLAEGGDSDDVDDPGGTTRYGISLRYLKSKGSVGDIDGDGDVDAHDIRALTREKVAEFYKQDFWQKCYCHKLPAPLAVIIFDQAVNTGVRTTARMLQSQLNVKVDGIIGPITAKAASDAFQRHSQWFITSYLGKRAQYYTDITRANSSLSKFLHGWFNRLFHLQQYVLERW